MLLKTEPQREAARNLGRIGVGALGFGGMAAALMMIRRKQERSLLDVEKAQALLPMPVYTENPREKEAGIPSGLQIGPMLSKLKPPRPAKALALVLGTLGLGGTTLCQRRDGQT